MTDHQLSEIRARLDAYILADDPNACGDFVFSAGQDVAALLGYVDDLRTKLAAIAAVVTKES